jgi:hypothetical protein
MGNLTTLTIYNDGIDLIPKHAQAFADALLESSQHAGTKTIRVGNFCNLVKVHDTRHADAHTTYVHMGNTVCEMSPWSTETKRLMRESPQFFEKMLKFMRAQVKDLSDEFKKIQESQKAPSSL